MKKIYETPSAEQIVFASQDALTASDIYGMGGVNWNDATSWFTPEKN